MATKKQAKDEVEVEVKVEPEVEEQKIVIPVLKQPYETAILIANLMRLSGKSRIRLTNRTLKKFSGRTQVSYDFFNEVDIYLRQYGYLIVKLNIHNSASGYIVMTTKGLLTTRPVDVNSFFPRSQRINIINGDFDFKEAHKEIIADLIEAGEYNNDEDEDASFDK